MIPISRSAFDAVRSHGIVSPPRTLSEIVGGIAWLVLLLELAYVVILALLFLILR